ncbi:MAG: tetratricopeptide repeat protein [Bacteroidia bacterium]
MKYKKLLYTAFVVFFATAILAIIYSGKKKETEIPKLKERQGAIALGSEWLNTKKAINELEYQIESNPDNAKLQLQLAMGYIQEARITGDFTYYDGAALRLINKVLEKDSMNFEALCCKSSIMLSQHHFADALPIALKAQKINPYNAYVYGNMCDAYVETGNYTEAIKAADKMNELRPDRSSYARVSYLREILGNYPGAIEAMKMAVEAGMPGTEGSEWCRVQLGHLYEKTGDKSNAEKQYQSSLAYRPKYAYALAGMGRILKSQGRCNEALVYFTDADVMVKDYSFKDELYECYHLSNQPEKAKKALDEAIKTLSDDATAANSDQSIGHYADRELAYMYIKAGDLDKALDHALMEYNRRPDNIDVNETVAWVYYNRGEYNNALNYIVPALKTRSLNAELLGRASLIYQKNNLNESAVKLAKIALRINPDLHKELADSIKKNVLMNNLTAAR